MSSSGLRTPAPRSIFDDAERWFRPFESTTLETDPVLGQGMGMGLPITRNMLEEYGASIDFVSPSRGFGDCHRIILSQGTKCLRPVDRRS